MGKGARNKKIRAEAAQIKKDHATVKTQKTITRALRRKGRV